MGGKGKVGLKTVSLLMNSSESSWQVEGCWAGRSLPSLDDLKAGDYWSARLFRGCTTRSSVKRKCRSRRSSDVQDTILHKDTVSSTWIVLFVQQLVRRTAGLRTGHSLQCNTHNARIKWTLLVKFGRRGRVSSSEPSQRKPG